MFSFLKKKYTLTDVLPNGYTDIHNHLLPGIDDGAETVEQTSALVNSMKTLGISNCISTPHTFSGCWDNTSVSIKNAFEIATENKENNDFIKGFASEYMLDNSLVESASNQSLLCLSDSNLLVELSYLNAPYELYELLFELKLKGYQIILAHPERYKYFFADFRNFEKLKDFDIDFQLNLLSLTGYYGPDVLKMSLKLMDAGMYSFTGTDIHHSRHIKALQTQNIMYKNETVLTDLLGQNNLFSK
jgi:tyrosine-protein phosphatase YwqE